MPKGVKIMMQAPSPWNRWDKLTQVVGSPDYLATTRKKMVGNWGS
jgi:hypothetical protein